MHRVCGESVETDGCRALPDGMMLMRILLSLAVRTGFSNDFWRYHELITCRVSDFTLSIVVSALYYLRIRLLKTLHA